MKSDVVDTIAVRCRQLSIPENNFGLRFLKVESERRPAKNSVDRFVWSAMRQTEEDVLKQKLPSKDKFQPQ